MKICDIKLYIYKHQVNESIGSINGKKTFKDCHIGL